MHLFYRHVHNADAHETAWALLSDALHKLGLSQPEATLRRTPLGKPYFAEADAPHFSLSHTKTLVACAIGNAPIGVDIEPEDRRISAAVCHRFLEDCAPEDALRCWTQRESFGKLTGEGVASQAIPFDKDKLCFDSYIVAGHLLTVCRQKAEPQSEPQEL